MQIVNYEGLYDISDTGIVTAKSRIILNKNSKEQYYPERILKMDKGQMGHCRVTLSKEGKTSRYLVHRLVAEHFIPNPLNKPHINHIDNDPTNNDVGNLEWCTHSENMIHAQKQGRLFSSQSKGGKNGGIRSAKSLRENNQMIGSIKGCWRIISLADKRGKNQYFNVECVVCNNSATREKSYLKVTDSPNCIKCKVRD